MKDFLSKSQISELKADHRAERELRYGDRIKAILMLNSGVSVSKIAEYLLLDEKTIRKYQQRYLDGGLEGLCNDSYQGRESLLSLAEQDELERELRSKIYPTTASIICYVKKRFQITYSISGMTSLLRRMGFSYKKPQAVPGKANAKAQREFLAMLSELKLSKNEADPILYLDGVHPQHNSHPDYGWLPQGEKIQLKTNTGRKRVTLSGALDADSHEIVVQEDKVLNADNTIKFFKKIESKYPAASVVYLILDNAGYYKGKKIREYLERSSIELLYLPPYAPNLNLIERVWKFFKKKVLANAYYESFLEFRKACKKFFRKRTWQSHKAELETLLVDNFQITNA
jgi:transposase